MADPKIEGDKDKDKKVRVRAPTSLKTLTDMQSFLGAHEGHLAVVVFMQDWAESCASTYNIVVELANEAEQEHIGFAEVVAEEHPDICEKFKVVGVPSVVFFRKNKEIDRVVGVRVREVASKLKFHAVNNVLSSSLTVTTPPGVEYPDGRKARLEQRLKTLIDSAEVMVFIKGTPKEPKCGFSRTIVQILSESGIPYGSFDILSDDDVRQGLKTFSNWQTYPQLYVKGQLVGGLDIVKELKESEDLVSTLKGEC